LRLFQFQFCSSFGYSLRRLASVPVAMCFSFSVCSLFDSSPASVFILVYVRCLRFSFVSTPKPGCLLGGMGNYGCFPGASWAPRCPKISQNLPFGVSPRFIYHIPSDINYQSLKKELDFLSCEGSEFRMDSEQSTSGL